MRAAGQKLKRLLKEQGWGRRPFPVETLCAAFWRLLRDVLVLALEEWALLRRLGQLTQWSGHHASLSADELTEDSYTNW